MHGLPRIARGSDRRRDRRAASVVFDEGGEPPARPEEHPRLVPVVSAPSGGLRSSDDDLALPFQLDALVSAAAWCGSVPRSTPHRAPRLSARRARPLAEAIGAVCVPGTSLKYDGIFTLRSRATDRSGCW